ncbi:MAG: cytochrome-c peroxidase [Bacteroidia bacterium]
MLRNWTFCLLAWAMLVSCHPSQVSEADRLALGKALFLDGRFSADGRTSCASCHRPDYAFADTVSFSLGVHGRRSLRNTPTLVGIPLDIPLMADGGVPPLRSGSMAVLAALTAHRDLGMNPRSLNSKLMAYPLYREWLRRVEPDKDLSSAFLLTLHSYVRSLAQPPGSVDANHRPIPLSESAGRGKSLFFGQAGCSRCHNGPSLSDGQFYNLGFADRQDPGRASITLREEDRGRTRTPILKNLNLTPPYFYDGRAKDLREVLEHYQKGAGEAGRWMGDSLQFNDLLAFLESL